MSTLTLNIPFTEPDPTKYTYDTDDIQLTGGVGKLKLQNVNQDFSETFDADTGFTYDNALAEFISGLVRQKDTRPTDATFYVSYNTDINGDWGNGVLTGTGYNGAGITGNKLDLSGGSNKYIDYDADGNADSQQTGCIRLKWTPKYTGAGSSQFIIELTESIGVSNNRIRIYHTGTLLFIAISNSVGGSIVSMAETFSPVADTEYEIELDWDITAGATRLFVDGTQLGSTQAGTGIRDANIGLMRLGKDLNGNGNADFLIDDILIFSTVQHTSNYTPDWTTVYDTIYRETPVILPEMEHTGDGTIQLFNTFSTTETGSPRYTIQIGRSGNYLYWNGAAWAVSDGTYVQANDATTFNTNAASLPVAGEVYGQFKIVFPDSNTQSSVDTLTANMAVQLYATDNPYIEYIDTLNSEGLLSFTATETITGSDALKYNLYKGNTLYYHDGSQWITSDGTYAQSNTATEIDDNIDDFTDTATRIKVRVYLHSATGETTPEIDNIAIEYDFVGDTECTLSKCWVWGVITNNDGDPVSGKTFKISLNKAQVKYTSDNNNCMIDNSTILVTSRVDGYWEAELITTDNMEAGTWYYFKFSDMIYKKYVPEQDSANFYELTEVA